MAQDLVKHRNLLLASQHLPVQHLLSLQGSLLDYLNHNVDKIHLLDLLIRQYFLYGYL